MSQQLLEEILQQTGIKGMHWGIRKSINRKIDSMHKSRSVSLNKFHEKNKDKKYYSQKYKNNLKLTKGNHNKAVELTLTNIRARNIKIVVAIVAAAKIAKVVATRPETVRKGKNLIQAFKGSPIRYVDGSKFKNVINL